MYQIGNLVSECFPETARVFYGLSKSEFVTEPDIEHLAIKNGLLKAAAAKGHHQRVTEMLRDTRLGHNDLFKPFKLAAKNHDFTMMEILSSHARFEAQRFCIGWQDVRVAKWCLENPKFPPPKSNDVTRAAFGPHGGVKHGTHIEWNDLSTLKAILADARLHLEDKYCKDVSDTLCIFLEESIWQEEGLPCPIFNKKMPPGYVSYTNIRDLAEILFEHPRFAAYSEDLRAAWLP